MTSTVADEAVDYGTLPKTSPADIDSVIVVFDGWCGMCTRSARLLDRLDKRGRVQLVASQAHGAHDRTGITAAQADVAAWTVMADGTSVGGARAIGLALAVGRGARWPVVAWKLPVLPWVLDRVYGFIADHRRWFPGETPWCEAHPGECADGDASCSIS